MKYEAVIFDWAGTTVDYGCFAPVQAFLDAFHEYGIDPTMEEVRGPMGMLKIEESVSALSGGINMAETGQKKTFRMFMNSAKKRFWRSFRTLRIRSHT